MILFIHSHSYDLMYLHVTKSILSEVFMAEQVLQVNEKINHK